MLIGTWQADGSIVVRAVVESDTVLLAAMSSHYTSVKKTLEDEKDVPPAPALPAPTPTKDNKSAVDEAVDNAVITA